MVEQNESEDVIELISNNQFQGIYIGQSFSITLKFLLFFERLDHDKVYKWVRDLENSSEREFWDFFQKEMTLRYFQIWKISNIIFNTVPSVEIRLNVQQDKTTCQRLTWQAMMSHSLLTTVNTVSMYINGQIILHIHLLHKMVDTAEI